MTRELDRAAARETALLSQIKDLTTKLATVADAKAGQVILQSDALHLRAESLARTAASADARRESAAGPEPPLPGMLTMDRLPGIMKAQLGMTGHYRAPLVLVEARAADARRNRDLVESASLPAAATTSNAHAREQEDVSSSLTTQPI
jgi:hypothetical protein